MSLSSYTFCKFVELDRLLDCLINAHGGEMTIGQVSKEVKQSIARRIKMAEESETTEEA